MRTRVCECGCVGEGESVVRSCVCWCVRACVRALEVCLHQLFISYLGLSLFSLSSSWLSSTMVVNSLWLSFSLRKSLLSPPLLEGLCFFSLFFVLRCTTGRNGDAGGALWSKTTHQVELTYCILYPFPLYSHFTYPISRANILSDLQRKRNVQWQNVCRTSSAICRLTNVQLDVLFRLRDTIHSIHLILGMTVPIWWPETV